MKKLLLALTCLMLMTGCKKTIEKIAQDAIVDAMVSGEWAVTSFTVNSTDKTADFTGYRFKYYRDKTVDAKLNGAVVDRGTWDGNGNAMTTWANFTDPAYPLDLINGTWNIVNSSWTHVTASQTVGSDVRTMRLDKQ